MTAEEFLSDIQIAKKYLNAYSLTADEKQLVTECCYYPPFHYKAYYAQIYKTAKNYYQMCIFDRMHKNQLIISCYLPVASVGRHLKNRKLFSKRPPKV